MRPGDLVMMADSRLSPGIIRVWSSDRQIDGRFVDDIRADDVCMVVHESDEMMLVITPRMKLGWVYLRSLVKAS